MVIWFMPLFVTQAIRFGCFLCVIFFLAFSSFAGDPPPFYGLFPPGDRPVLRPLIKFYPPPLLGCVFVNPTVLGPLDAPIFFFFGLSLVLGLRGLIYTLLLFVGFSSVCKVEVACFPSPFRFHLSCWLFWPACSLFWVYLPHFPSFDQFPPPLFSC